MKYLSVLLVLSLSLVACNKYENPFVDQEAQFEYKTERNKQLIKKVDTITSDYIRERYVTEDGDDIVFTFKQLKGFDNEVYDDEYTDIIRFEVPASATEFSYKGHTLLQAKVIYGAQGAWGGVSDRSVTEGIVSGKKIGDKTWEVMISVNVPTYEEGENNKNLYHTYRCEEE